MPFHWAPMANVFPWRATAVPKAATDDRSDGVSCCVWNHPWRDLVKTYNAPRDRITADVSAILTMLVEKQMMEL